MKQPANVDVSVLLLFHARSDHFSQVWAEVKKVRPARLFLYQDGPRRPLPETANLAVPANPAEPVVLDNPDNSDNPAEQVRPAWNPTTSKDWAGIQACRQLVADENIDWECEVHRHYCEENQGCDPSGYLSQQWAFSLTDKCIVLEDDVVPSQSFFTFCKEMLDRYENDERITMIAGFNTDETSPVPSQGGAKESYFFTRVFSIWGWASWARVINNRDGNYGFVKDPQQFALLKQKVLQYHQKKGMPQMCQDHAASGKQYFESIFWAYMLLHDGLTIMPRLNLINNIGMDSGTHYSAQLNLIPRRQRTLFTMRRLELSFPLTHPAEVVEYPDYQERFYLRNAWDHPWRKVQYSLEEFWLNLIHGNMGQIRKALCNRIRKTLGLQRAR